MTPWEEEELFRVAMQDVIPLNPGGRARIPPSRPQRPQPHFALQEELEAYAQLADWVRGSGSFELVYGDEYVDGGIVGLSPEVLQKLRGGEFSPQDHVDLHGFRYEDAREVVVDFVRRSFAQGLRCVLIVPGRGKNSKDRQPVLKEGLVKWLTRSPLKPIVLAFSSARSHHGGVGAFYVLLRRAPGSVPVVTPAR
jgi:DNA-nicking Smr family endonuclease